MRVSTPYHKNGPLLLGTFPGMTPRKYTVTNIHQVPTLGLTMEVDKPHAENKSDWFTPEVLRAARVFLKELSTAHSVHQYRRYCS